MTTIKSVPTFIAQLHAPTLWLKNRLCYDVYRINTHCRPALWVMVISLIALYLGSLIIYIEFSLPIALAKSQTNILPLLSDVILIITAAHLIYLILEALDSVLISRSSTQWSLRSTGPFVFLFANFIFGVCMLATALNHTVPMTAFTMVVIAVLAINGAVIEFFVSHMSPLFPRFLQRFFMLLPLPQPRFSLLSNPEINHRTILAPSLRDMVHCHRDVFDNWNTSLDRSTTLAYQTSLILYANYPSYVRQFVPISYLMLNILHMSGIVLNESEKIRASGWLTSTHYNYLNLQEGSQQSRYEAVHHRITDYVKYLNSPFNTPPLMAFKMFLAGWTLSPTDFLHHPDPDIKALALQALYD